MPLEAGGEFALVKEQLEKSLSLSGQPIRRGTMAHDHDVFAVLADTAALERNEAAVRRYAPRLEELARRDGHGLYLGVAHRAWGVAHRLANEHAQAHRRLSQAMELFEALGANWQIGRTFYEWAELDVQANGTSAHDHMARALAAFESLKATKEIERTRTALRALEGQK